MKNKKNFCTMKYFACFVSFIIPGIIALGLIIINPIVIPLAAASYIHHLDNTQNDLLLNHRQGYRQTGQQFLVDYLNADAISIADAGGTFELITPLLNSDYDDADTTASLRLKW